LLGCGSVENPADGNIVRTHDRHRPPNELPADPRAKPGSPKAACRLARRRRGEPEILALLTLSGRADARLSDRPAVGNVKTTTLAVSIRWRAAIAPA
jgi:hypothetical protein